MRTVADRATLPAATSGRASWVASAFIALFVMLTGFVSGGGPFEPVEFGWPEPFVAVLLLLCAASVIARGRIPGTAVAAVAVASSVARLVGINATGFDVATMVTFYAVAATSIRSRSLAVAAGVIVVALLPAMFLRPSVWTDGSIWHVCLTVGFAYALGQTSRSRAAQLAAFAGRAERAELTRESEARRQVVRERLRIARDLHDAVAHQIAVISLHAGAARSALPTKPDEVESSLLVISSAARGVLAEISTLLRLLRDDELGPQSDEAPLSTAPGIEDIATLIEDVRADGVRIAYSIHGNLQLVSERASRTAYRIARETLTNAYKHGSGGKVLFDIAVAESQLVILCRNQTSNTKVKGSPSSGHGLQGMAELVEAIGGVMTISKAGSSFQLRVSIPVGEAK